MAAANASFLYVKGWSSSEANLDQQLGILRQPPSNRIAIFSISMLGSLIVVVQGLQALYEVAVTAKHGFMLTQGVGATFTPLAIVSLFRLMSAPWITQDFAFVDKKDYDDDRDILPTNETDQAERQGDDHPQGIQMQSLSHGTEVDGDNRDETPEDIPIQPVFKNQRYWASILLRFGILASVAAIFIGQCFHIIGHPFGCRQSVSGLIMHFLYHIMSTVMLVLFTVYLTCGKGQDTMIPCINSMWYLIYTVIWYAFAVAVITVNALEMRRTSCGVYSTFPPSSRLDEELCRFYS